MIHHGADPQDIQMTDEKDLAKQRNGLKHKQGNRIIQDLKSESRESNHSRTNAAAKRLIRS
jgi:hypothetical protein